MKNKKTGTITHFTLHTSLNKMIKVKKFGVGFIGA